MNSMVPCWCNNKTLAAFSHEYSLCERCNTLISQAGLNLNTDKTLVKDDETDFYGKNYWLQHQSSDLGYPNIFQRSRSDRAERCPHWLRALLKYKLPPATILELGSSHGGFVSLLQSCGFDATGLELSPWIADYARKTFDINMLVGPIEEQNLAPASFDVIALMDVMEHLSNPVQTMSECLKLLKPDGILLIQTPNYPVGKTYADMLAEQSSFLEMLQAKEHLYLFSQDAVQQVFKQLGADFVEFEPAFFPKYDMFMVVSKSPIKTFTNDEIEKYLSTNSETRLVRSLLDSYSHHEASKMDSAERLNMINELHTILEEQKRVLDKSLVRKLRKLKII